MTKNTPQTSREFFDYRINETNDKVDQANKHLERIEKKLDDTFATKDYVDQKVKTLEKRVDSLESDRLWLIRLILGFIFMGILVAVVKFKG